MQILGRVIVLLFLIIILAAGGLVWFDHLNVIDIKTVLSPIYKFIGREGRTETEVPAEELLSLDAERFAALVESLDLRGRDLDRREEDIQKRMNEIEQMAQELEERQKALDEREKSINAVLQETENKDRNIEQISRYLTSMPPENAVAILDKTGDQDAIEIFRKTEEIAQAEGTVSMVSVWLMQLSALDENRGAQRVAELNRKMAARPPSVN
ncbi:MAG: flagellar protein FlbB [Treponema sp.]|nr:flagellar protein FlbB [Treponema sp.]